MPTVVSLVIVVVGVAVGYGLLKGKVREEAALNVTQDKRLNSHSGRLRAVEAQSAANRVSAENIQKTLDDVVARLREAEGATSRLTSTCEHLDSTLKSFDDSVKALSIVVSDLQVRMAVEEKKGGKEN